MTQLLDRDNLAERVSTMHGGPRYAASDQTKRAVRCTLVAIGEAIEALHPNCRMQAWCELRILIEDAVKENRRGKCKL